MTSEQIKYLQGPENQANILGGEYAAAIAAKAFTWEESNQYLLPQTFGILVKLYDQAYATARETVGGDMASESVDKVAAVVGTWGDKYAHDDVMQRAKQWMAMKQAAQRQAFDMETMTMSIATSEDKAKLESYVAKWEKIFVGDPSIEAAKERLRQLQAIENEAIEWREMEQKLREEGTSEGKRRFIEEYARKYPTSAHSRELQREYYETVKDDVVSRMIDGSRLADKVNTFNTLWVRQVVDDDVQGSLFKLQTDLRDLEACSGGGSQSLESWGAVHRPSDIEALWVEYKREAVKGQIEKIKENPIGFRLADLHQLYNDGLVDRKSLVSDGLITEGLVDKLLSKEVLALDQTVTTYLQRVDGYAQNDPEGFRSNMLRREDGATDVFFWGTPGTGKTTILTGLINARKNIHLRAVPMVVAGGVKLNSYGDMLMNNLNLNYRFGSTNTNVVATIPVEVITNRKICKATLIELAGEAFLNNIATATTLNFTDMGVGATELLKAKCKKLFYLVIDPTRDYIGVNGIQLKQADILDKMVSMMREPANRAIMEQVEAVHVIFTKCNLLGATEKEQDAKCQEKLRGDYLNMSRGLTELYKMYPKMDKNKENVRYYRHTLGKFYLCGMYEYDPSTSENLAKSIADYINGKERGIFDKIFG
ncbi:MAG: hypothetical protein II951_05815 [Bacteroidales bacterium]|nr:hypothetical protein [Bacteroidales bacterium]